MWRWVADLFGAVMVGGSVGGNVCMLVGGSVRVCLVVVVVVVVVVEGRGM